MKKTEDLRTNKGITLIALVITIIVMLILVAVTITMAVNGGLFDYARRAGQATNGAVANEQELANLEGNLTVEELINKYEKADYTLEDLELEVGSEVTFQVKEASYTAKYNQTGYEDDQTFTTVGTGEITWQVLRQEGDSIYLVGPQTNKGGGDDFGSFFLEGARGYLYGPNELNKICKAIFSYVDSNGKVYEARSMNEKDVLKLTGYNPSTDINVSSDYGKEISKLVSNVENTNYPVDNNGLPDIRQGFPQTMKYGYYYMNVSDLNLTNEKKEILCQYFYDGSMEDYYHWLASTCIDAYSEDAWFRVLFLQTGNVDSYDMFAASNYNNGANYPIRPVISLPSSVVKAIIEAE